MGMYPVQNYGDDFNKSMIGMGNFINGMQKTADDQVQRDKENARADQTLNIQKDTRDAAVRHSDAETAKLKREEENVTLLQGATQIYGRVSNGGELTDEDLPVLAKMRVKLPYLTNNLEDNQKLRDAHTTLIAANEQAKSLPASDAPFKFQRGDDPETDKVLDAWNVVASKDRHKTHADTDGTVTGTKGAEYSTDEIQAGAGFSSEGDARTAAYFSVVDANGNPIYQRDAQGNPTEQRQLVPATIDKTNDTNARLDFIPADALIMKSRLALDQLDAENRLTPVQRAKLKKEIEINMYGLIPGGAEKLLSTQVKNNKPITVSKDTDVIDPQSGELIYSNKSPAKLEYKSRTRQEGVKEVFEESQDGGRTWAKVSDGPKFNPRPDNNVDHEYLANKRDISIRLRDAQRSHQAALKTGDPDTINEAVSTIESLNDAAKEYGVKPQPVPNRRFSSDETRLIQEQAKKNLEEKRSKISKVFGSVPSKPAIDQEVRRLKLTLKPGNVAFDEPQPQQQVQPQQQAPGVQAQHPAQQEIRQKERQDMLANPQQQPQTQTAIFNKPPPAWKHDGKLIQDHSTGKKYRSVKGQWVEVN
jgi:hypothetical protein